ncbi:MAG TPA: hypothetical protein DCY85_07330 [Firmicutes bacterium]|nr:hypothetical protein [Bacillota bacterium]
MDNDKSILNFAAVTVIAEENNTEAQITKQATRKYFNDLCLLISDTSIQLLLCFPYTNTIG